MVENDSAVPDSLRLDVVEVPAGSGGGFEVRVLVNEVEMTSADWLSRSR